MWTRGRKTHYIIKIFCFRYFLWVRRMSWDERRGVWRRGKEGRGLISLSCPVMDWRGTRSGSITRFVALLLRTTMYMHTIYIYIHYIYIIRQAVISKYLRIYINVFCKWILISVQIQFDLLTFLFLIIIITINLYCAEKCRSKLRGAGHCTSAARMTNRAYPIFESVIRISPLLQKNNQSVSATSRPNNNHFI